MRGLIAVLAAALLATPAHAQWRAANPQVEEAAKNPRVKAVLELRNKLNAALVAGDTAGFMSVFTPDTVVNSPFNNIATAEMARQRSASGVLTYKYLITSVEYAAPRRDDEVVLMGEETYEPPAGAPHAGKTVRRRFTDLWRLQNGEWKLSLRQATIFEAK